MTLLADPHRSRFAGKGIDGHSLVRDEHRADARMEEAGVRACYPRVETAVHLTCVNASPYRHREQGVHMSVTLETATGPLNIRALHERMGRVYHQPVRVRSFTNKRFTVNFRVPLEQLRRIVPEAIDLDEIPGTGLGMFSMCACDFWVSRFGWVPIPPVRNNDMLLRISAKVRKGNNTYRAYYTLRSDSSSRFLGFFGKRFSHFRKQV